MNNTRKNISTSFAMLFLTTGLIACNSSDSNDVTTEQNEDLTGPGPK